MTDFRIELKEHPDEQASRVIADGLERVGYELFVTLEGYPPGYRQFHLKKTLRSE